MGCTSQPSEPVATQLGNGDGSPGSVELTLIFEPDAILQATDVAFNPSQPGQLWVLHRLHPPYVPCEEATRGPDCLLVEGSVAIMGNGTDPMSPWVFVKDSNAWHFMRLPPAIAFGEGQTFATCGEARTGNFDDNPHDFIGPTLFSSNLSIFGVVPRNDDTNGSHLDMLHASPWCMGIAHERDNAYWVFNGMDGSLDRYDFHRDHGPGQDDHSDGEIFHYATGAMTRTPGVPSHLHYHEPSRQLFVADTGAGRVVKLDTTSGDPVADYTPNYDALPTHQVIGNAGVHEVVPPGTLDRPSGLEVLDNVLFVADNATSILYAFSLDGDLLRKLDTGLPPGSIAGITIGPDNRLYLADLLSGNAYRIDP